MRRFFITGTDTNCGKTYVTCQLLKYFVGIGKKVHAIKPVATGCEKQGDVYFNEDKEQLTRYNAQDFPKKSWEFVPPISPHLAAQAAGVSLLAQEIVASCKETYFQILDYLLIEGAGGVCVPLNATETWLDVMQQLQAEVIVVIGMRLGCLNHALLTEMILKQNGIPIVGWIANCLDKDMLFLEENILSLKQRLTSPHLATLTYCGKINHMSKSMSSMSD